MFQQLTVHDAAKLRCSIISLSEIQESVFPNLNLPYQVIQQQEDLTRLFDGIKPIGRTEHISFDLEKYTYNIFNRSLHENNLGSFSNNLNFDSADTKIQLPGQSRIGDSMKHRNMLTYKNGQRGYFTSKTGKVMTFDKRCHTGKFESMIADNDVFRKRQPNSSRAPSMHVDDFEKNNKNGGRNQSTRGVGRMNTVNEFFQERGVSGGVSRNRYSCNSHDFQFRPKKYTV